MKKKSKHQPVKKKKEFRYHITESINEKGNKVKIWHPAYVFLEKGNTYIYVSITHSSEINNILIIKLKSNPNPCDMRDSYFVADIKTDTKDRFSKRRNGWVMNDEDDLLIRELFENK